MIKLAAEDGNMRATTAVQGGDASLGDLIETSIVFQSLEQIRVIVFLGVVR